MKIEPKVFFSCVGVVWDISGRLLSYVIRMVGMYKHYHYYIILYWIKNICTGTVIKKHFVL